MGWRWPDVGMAAVVGGTLVCLAVFCGSGVVFAAMLLVSIIHYIYRGD